MKQKCLPRLTSLAAGSVIAMSAIAASALVLPGAFAQTQPGAGPGIQTARPPAQRSARTQTGPGINLQDPFGLTPLHWAVQNSDDRLAAQLLASGANPDIQDELGQTPLHLACMLGEKAMVQLILTRSHPDISLRDEDNMTPLQWAAEGSHREIVRLLLGYR
ncbi:MAG: ankyrin repeat domain-containing protein [Chloroflexi bacterium]|nr:ankyrin repeat domain-containing protein [Chloroflexota bacterium]